MKVREGGEGAVPAAGAEILLQPIETASLEEITCSCGVPCCSTGCFLKALQFTDSPHQIRLIPKDCSQWKDPPWNREQGVVNTNCYGLTLTPHSLCTTWKGKGGGTGVENKGAKLSVGKGKGREGKVVFHILSLFLSAQIILTKTKLIFPNQICFDHDGSW